MGNTRHVGQVVRIRVNPRDCLSVLDVVQVTAIDVKGMSFASIISMTFSSLLESLRKQGTIPRNEGFDFEVRMRPYLEGKSTANKRAITERIYLDGIKSPTNNPSNIGIPVDELGVPQLVDEYHRLKSCTDPQDRERLVQVQKRLDAGIVQ